MEVEAAAGDQQLALKDVLGHGEPYEYAYENTLEQYALLFDKAGNQLPYVLHMNTRGVYTHGMHYHGVNADGSWHEPVAELSGTGNEGTLFDPSDDDAATLYGGEPIPSADEAKPRREPHQIAAEKALEGQQQVEKAEQRAAAASQATNYQLTSNAGKSNKATDQAQVARAYSAAAKKEGAAAVRQPLPLTCCRRASRGLSTSCAEAEDGARRRGGYRTPGDAAAVRSSFVAAAGGDGRVCC